MMNCILNLEKLEPDNRNEFILFATHEFIIYRNRNRIVLASCNGEELSQAVAPMIFSHYECVDLEDSVLIILGGTDIVILDKNGLKPISHKLDKAKVGKCITKMYQFSEDSVIFGTIQSDRIQFINYNFMEQRRETQTSFWKMNRITDIYFDNDTNILYSVLDNSVIAACNMKTGETLWTKFEAAKINRGLVTHEGYLFYGSQGLLKKTDGKNTETIRIPLASPCSLEYSDGVSIFLTNNCKSICRYDVNSQVLVWEIYGRHLISDSLVVQAEDGAKLLLLQTKDYISIVNITVGKSESFIKTPNIAKMRVTGDHLLIHKDKNATTLIPGIERIS